MHVLREEFFTFGGQMEHEPEDRHVLQLRTLVAAARSPFAGYVVGVGIPLGTMLVGSRVDMPAFVFEHVVILFVVGMAVLWGLAPAVVAALAAALGDNIMLRDPAGRPTITGFRDVLDLVMFVAVAVAVGWLVATARRERALAQAAADSERHAREERDRVVAMVSHDLVTPLAVIRGTIQLARNNRDLALTTDPERLWLRLDTAATRAATLVGTLTDACQLDAGNLALDLRVADLRELLVPVVRMMDRLSEQHAIALTLPNQPQRVLCDEDRLQRVFENLLTNAIKYSPGGGAIGITVMRDDEQVVVDVQDHGIGISTDALPHLFERGFRAREAIATAPGLGLGLGIAAEIVHRHHGTIAARRGFPRGSILTVRLPRLADYEDTTSRGFERR